jgi:hypothetical protein
MAPAQPGGGAQRGRQHRRAPAQRAARRSGVDRAGPAAPRRPPCRGPRERRARARPAPGRAAMAPLSMSTASAPEAAAAWPPRLVSTTGRGDGAACTGEPGAGLATIARSPWQPLAGGAARVDSITPSPSPSPGRRCADERSGAAVHEGAGGRLLPPPGRRAAGLRPGTRCRFRRPCHVRAHGPPLGSGEDGAALPAERRERRSHRERSVPSASRVSKLSRSRLERAVGRYSPHAEGRLAPCAVVRPKELKAHEVGGGGS